MAYEVRKLKAVDIRRIAPILASEMDLIRSLSEKTEGEDKEKRNERIGIEVVQMIAGRHLDELWGWIADLGNMTPEELDDEPLSAPMEIIAEVAASGDIRDFLSRVRALAGTLKSNRAG